MSFKNIVTGFLLTAFATSLGFLAIEYGLSVNIVGHSKGGYKFFLDLAHGDVTGTLYKLKANTTISFADITRHANNYGFVRDNDISLTPDPQTDRIMVYGDSVTFGVYLQANQTYSSILEKILQNNHPKKSSQILIAGRGNSPLQYAAHIKSDVPTFRPAMVIVQVELLNDISDELMYTILARDEYNIPSKWIGGRYKTAFFRGDQILLSNIGWGVWETDTKAILFPVAGGYLQRTLLYTYTTRLLGTLASQKNNASQQIDGNPYYYYNLGFDKFLLTPPRLAHAFDQMFSTLEGTYNFCRAQGVEFLLLITPPLFVYQDSNSFGKHSRWILTQAEDRATKQKIPTLIVTEDLKKRGGEKLFFDFCHLNEKGNQVIAEALAKKINPQ